MADPERITGWEEAEDRDRLTMRERARLTKEEIRSYGIFSLLFVLMLFLSVKSLSSDQLFCWPVVAITVLFGFMDSAAGMGFGTAVTPLLLVMGYGSLEIIPAIMIQQAFAGLSTAYIHKELGNISWRLKPPSESVKLALILFLSGCLAAVVSITSVYFLLPVKEVWIKLYVGFLLAFMGIISFFTLNRTKAYRPKKLFAFGALAGFNKGIGGGGYGPVVTLGGMLSGVPPKSMTAITALAEGMVCIASVINWEILRRKGTAVDYLLLPSMILGSGVSIIAAPYVVRILPGKTLKKIIPAYCLIICLVHFGKML